MSCDDEDAALAHQLELEHRSQDEQTLLANDPEHLSFMMKVIEDSINERGKRSEVSSESNG